MREMAASGFMSNRGRQNVASFFTKDLGLDWRIGAEWFESQLIDYDVGSKYVDLLKIGTVSSHWGIAAGAIGTMSLELGLIQEKADTSTSRNKHPCTMLTLPTRNSGFPRPSA